MPRLTTPLLVTRRSRCGRAGTPPKLCLIAPLRPTHRSVACSLNLHNHMSLLADWIAKPCFMHRGVSELAWDPYSTVAPGHALRPPIAESTVLTNH